MADSLLWLTAIAALLVVLLIALMSRKKSRMTINVGGPMFKSWPINRLAIKFFLNPTKAPWLLEEATEKYGPSCYANVFGVNFIITRDLEIIRYILKHREAFPLPPEFSQALSYTMGKSMFTSEGELWKQKHDLLQPMMKLDMLQANTEQVFNKAVTLTQALIQLQKQSQKDVLTVEIIQWLKKLTVDVIGEAAFGVDFRALANEKPLEGHAVSEVAEGMLEAINERSTRPKFLWWLPTNQRRLELKFAGILTSAFRGILAQAKLHSPSSLDFYQHQEQQQQQNPAGHNNSDSDSEGDRSPSPASSHGGSKVNNLVSLLLSARKVLGEEKVDKVYPEQAILGECFSFFAAGHDSTTHSTGHLLEILSRHPEVQEKVRAECRNLAEKLRNQRREEEEEEENDRKKGEPGRLDLPLPSYRDLEQLKYLGAVIKESQRIRPLVTSLIRQSSCDVTIGGVNFPKGTSILLLSHQIHMDPSVYPDPEKFIPERWLSDSFLAEAEQQEANPYKAKGDPFVHLAFGAGPRSCFGRKFALLEMKMMVYVLLQQFRLVDSGIPLELEFRFGLVSKDKKLQLTLQPL